jgi:hypothetical protein
MENTITKRPIGRPKKKEPTFTIDLDLTKDEDIALTIAKAKMNSPLAVNEYELKLIEDEIEAIRKANKFYYRTKKSIKDFILKIVNKIKGWFKK